MNNPLLEEHHLPPFNDIEIKHMKPAIEARIEQIWSVLNKQLAIIEQGEPASWQNIVVPLEEVSDLLNQSWSPVSHINCMQNSYALRVVCT